MRRLGVAVFVLLCAGLADAQIAWLGAGVGTSFEYNPPAWPSKSSYHSSDLTPSVILALRMDEDTNLRFRFAELPFQAPVTSASGVVEAWPARLQATTVGVDYLMEDSLGRLVLSGGLGAYKLDFKASQPPPDTENARFGWYLGVGEWFRVSRRVQATLEFTMDKADHTGNPTIFTAAVGLVYGF